MHQDPSHLPTAALCHKFYSAFKCNFLYGACDPGKEKGPKEKSSLDEMGGDSEGTLLVTVLLGQSSPRTPLVGCVLTLQRLTIHPSTTVPHTWLFNK